MSATATTNRDIKNIRSRLERWELTHLRALAASLHEQLESAETRATEAESWANTWWRNAETLQEELLQLAEESGARVGLTQQGDIVVLQTGTTPETTPPAPGQHWPAQGGIYIGIASAEGDLPARHLVALDIEPSKERMDWADAVKWAASIGNGARLCTQLEGVHAYTTARHAFKTNGYYWTGTQTSRYYAFVQGFETGLSFWGIKGYERRVRAFRGLALQTFTPLITVAAGDSAENFSTAAGAA